ncbi:MAG: Protein tolQ [candidate division TM6 bacterium GW2011_GWF2_43_17]|nr:MAG: Protein tolQ [candidate division TM6 bacterium GW2011_GWF2_43_17]HAU30484.1 hypothetical protein [Candidatus Dependentiae bacterium]
MKHVFAAQSFWSLMFHSSFLSKLILLSGAVVLFLVLFFFFYKYFLIREYRVQVARAQSVIARSSDFADLVSVSSTLAGTYPGMLLNTGLTALKKSIESHSGSGRIEKADSEAFSNAISLSFNRIVQAQYQLLPFLSVSAAVSPLVGLFGTITGLIQSFMAIGRTGSADLASIAPGIAEALLTTFAGLVVAIPAFVLFHVLTTYIRSFEFELEQLVVGFEGLVEKQVVACAN